MKPYPEYTAVSFYRNNVGVTTNYQGLALSIRQRLSRGLTYSAAYTRSKLTDIASSVFDASILTGPLTNAAVADSHNLERDRDYSTGDIPHYFAASVVWDLPLGEGRAKQLRGLVGALVNDWSVASFMTMQSGRADRGDAGELARVCRLHDPAPESGRRSDAARRSSGRQRTGSTPRRSRRPISSPSGPRRAIQCGGRRIAMSISR